MRRAQWVNYPTSSQCGSSVHTAQGVVVVFPPAALGLIRKMTDRLDGIRVLITGAASGIGAACARRMARDGARLLLADLNGEGAKTLADELGQASVQAARRYQKKGPRYWQSYAMCFLERISTTWNA